MSEVKWIKIVTDLFEDEKILLIETMPKADSIIVIWFKLLCLAGKQNNNGMLLVNNQIPYDYKMLASVFKRKETLVKQALEIFEKYGMIEIINEVVAISNWEKHQNIEGMDKIRQQTKNRVQKYREKQKEKIKNVSCNVTVTQSNETEKEEEKEIDKEYIAVDNKLSNIVKYYEANIGLLVPTTAIIVKDLVETFSKDLIKKAIDIACVRNVRNMSYIQGILKDWERKGYKTLADIESEKKLKKQDDVNSQDILDLYEN